MFKIVNIKCSVKCVVPVVFKENNNNNFCISKRKNNFYILRSREKPFVISVFTKFINITGIKNTCSLKEARSTLEELFNVTIKQLRVDNYTVCVHNTILPTLFLPNLTDFIQRKKTEYSIQSARFNPDVFCALFVRMQKERAGTFIIFKSSKVILLGCRCETQIQETIEIFNGLLTRYKHECFL